MSLLWGKIRERRGRKGQGKRLYQFPAPARKLSGKLILLILQEENHCRFWFLFEKKVDNLTH